MSAEDREALRQLAYDYAACVDRCDADGLIALFTADGLVGASDTSVPAFAGEAGLRTMIGQVDQMFVKTMHNVFNHTFAEVGADEAHGETTCIASHVLDDGEGGWQVLDMALRYANRYRRTAEGWRFAERRLTVEWVETRPVQRFDPQGLAMRGVDA
jgi:ketosteroid isomerase-like protein